MELHIIIIPLIFLLLTIFLKKPKSQAKQPLPGPWNLPVIGGLHHLLGQQPPHQTIHCLSAIHGPIMSLKLGEIRAVVVSSSVVAKEIMKTHDTIFATRPINSSINAICYGGKDIAFAPYGDFWRQMRRLCLLELFSVKRVRSFRHIRKDEISNLIKFIAASAAEGATVNLSGLFLQLSNSITARASVGGKTADQKLFQAALGEVVELISGFCVVDLFPSMPFISHITGFQRKLQQCQLKLDHINKEIIEEHRKKRKKQLVEEEDITDVLLRIQEDGSLQFPITDDHIKAIINDLLVGGTETTATAIEWAMSELIRNPSVMRRAQREVRHQFGRPMATLIAEEDVMSSGRLPYLHLVIKETLRMHPPIPLLLPRENQESCEVMGYEISAKTTVMVNAWAIGRRDPDNWDEPNVFRPERFEESGVDFKGGHMDFIPFGAGRRICPGMQFGLATIEMALAHLLYYFDWEHLGEEGEGLLDMSEAFGISAKRKFPLCLLPICRNPLPPGADLF
ncbi:LOW QUALITY PROTEIN: 5-epiaristolochene 1,3-dihydroxylase-like [Phalaenopsis equestris]|uniref:LOW QUALITY PROTEIN: 5-epiaristolochene 1,3-dihydroxylase-like n=1 Tax=Phalaenopsis equestris TaxID=78828 RepID=UPI0009E42717|nr:LOW QUALITY PROTEIN: 5-epiaristolochene 1,3-dihydroxylase-like [Phalaenopsis equestris]